MTPLRHPVVLARDAARRAARDEAGYSVIELMASLLVLGIALSMTAVIVFVLTRQSTSQINQGRSTDAAQLTSATLAGFLRGAVTPAGAALASGAVTPTSITTVPSGSSSLPCWGNSSPAPSPASPLLAYDPSGTTRVSVTGTNGVTISEPVVDPSTVSIIYAHDYDLEFCAYPANSSTPHVYEIYVDTTTCASATYGFCQLKVVDYGAFPNGTFTRADYVTPANGKLVRDIGSIWCDAACQGTGAQANSVAHTSCWSYLPPTASGTAQTVPAMCSGISTATESKYTPPLFQYFESGTAGSQVPENNASNPMDLICTAQSGSPSTCNDASNATDHTSNLLAAGITTVRIDLTILANQNPALAAPGGNPGTTVVNDVPLVNLTSKSVIAPS